MLAVHPIHPNIMHQTHARSTSPPVSLSPSHLIFHRAIGRFHSHPSRLSILTPRHDPRLLPHPQVLPLDHLDRKARGLVPIERAHAHLGTNGHNLRLGVTGLVKAVFCAVLGAAFLVGVDEVVWEKDVSVSSSIVRVDATHSRYSSQTPASPT